MRKGTLWKNLFSNTICFLSVLGFLDFFSICLNFTQPLDCTVDTAHAFKVSRQCLFLGHALWKMKIEWLKSNGFALCQAFLFLRLSNNSNIQNTRNCHFSSICSKVFNNLKRMQSLQFFKRNRPTYAAN